MGVWRYLPRRLRSQVRRTADSLAVDAKLRTRFVAITAVTIGAMLTIIAAIIFDTARSERASLEARARLLARSSALMIDREMSRLDALLTGLATSPALKVGDLATFHAQAAGMPRPEGCWILLFDPDMNHRMNAQWPWGTPLPVAAERSQQEMRKALEHARFTNLIYAPNQQRFVASIVVPVEVEAVPGWLLAATVPAETLGKVIGELHLPRGWFGGIFDRDGITIDRVPRRQDFTGEPAAADLVAAIWSGREGTLESVTREGVPVFSAFSRSELSGWTAAVGIPLSQLEAPQKRALALVGIGGLLVLLAGMGTAALVGRRLARPVAEQLELSDQRFRNVADSAPVLIWMTGPDQAGVYFNKPWLAFTGRSLEQALGNGWLQGVHPDDSERFLEIYSSSVDKRQPFRTEHRLRRADGEYRWVENCGVPQLGRDGTFYGCIGGGIDITDRKLAEQAIRESEERFRVMAETVPAMLFTTGPNGRCDYANQRYHAYVGTSPESVGEVDWLSRVHPDDAMDVLENWASCIESGVSYSGQFRLRNVEGAYRWFAVRACPVRGDDGLVIRWLGSALDIHDLNQALNSLESLSGRLLSVQSEERRRIARELHDSTAQVLAAASLDLTRLRDAFVLPDTKVAAILAELVALNNQALQEVRTLSYLFHPPTLEGQSLDAALRSYIRGFSRRSGIKVDVSLAQDLGPLSDELKIALFRIAQEGLVNVHRHSGTARAFVRLARTGSSAVLEIRDEGGGIRGTAAEVDLGVGIAGMRTRLQHLGGTLEIESGAGGTTVRATVPIERRSDHVVTYARHLTPADR
jgi:PAS domain S-box-containing protein